METLNASFREKRRLTKNEIRVYDHEPAPGGTAQ